MAWHRETTAKDMTSMAEYHIPRSDIEVQRLLTFVQKCHALGHPQLQYTWRHAWLLKVAEPLSSACDGAGYSGAVASRQITWSPASRPMCGVALKRL
jgi:hypothetical protein